MIKKHTHRTKHVRPRLPVIIALATVLSAGIAQAQVAVPSSVNFDTGTSLYTYSYSVTNNGPTFDLAIVNVPVASGSNLMNLTSPSGFTISFDPGPGIVSFLEDSDPGTLPTFAPGSTRGLFSFTSSLAPALVTFDALDAGGNSFTGTTSSPNVVVPEPGALSLLGATLLAPALLARRRRDHSASPLNHPTQQ